MYSVFVVMAALVYGFLVVYVLKFSLISDLSNDNLSHDYLEVSIFCDCLLLKCYCFNFLIVLLKFYCFYL